MKTLLEWLEENRSSLRDGIYEVNSMGNVLHNGKCFWWHADVQVTSNKYDLFNGNITPINAWTPATDTSVRESHAGKKENKYNRKCKGVTIDVYDVLKAFDVTDPALQHLIKKALCAGLRGHKNKEQDLIDIKDSAVRALELYHDDNRSAEGQSEVPGVCGCSDNTEAIYSYIKGRIDSARNIRDACKIPRP